VGEEADHNISVEFLVVLIVWNCDGLPVHCAADFNLELRCNCFQACDHDWCDFLGGDVAIRVYVGHMACICLVFDVTIVEARGEIALAANGDGAVDGGLFTSFSLGRVVEKPARGAAGACGSRIGGGGWFFGRSSCGSWFQSGDLSVGGGRCVFLCRCKCRSGSFAVLRLVSLGCGIDFGGCVGGRGGGGRGGCHRFDQVCHVVLQFLLHVQNDLLKIILLPFHLFHRRFIGGFDELVDLVS
jgi:hypothetical protein